jgi:DNA-binding SARP family transcriptional activator
VPLSLLQAIVARAEQELIDLLWPDSEGDAGHRVFDTTLYRLRKLLGVRDAIALYGGRVRLEPKACWTDLWALEHAQSNLVLAAMRRPPDVAAVERAAERVFAVYRGPAFAGDEGLATFSKARARICERLVRDVITVGLLRENAGEPERALDAYRRGLEADEGSRPLQERVIACLVRMNRHAEAERMLGKRRSARGVSDT